MKKNIILLTDGQLYDTEEVINLIGANSSEFSFHSIGIGDCDEDLIERTAIVGNGYSYFISNLDELNSIVISLLQRTQNLREINCTTNQKCLIEDDNEKIVFKYDYFTHGFILDETNIKNIEFNFKKNEENLKILFDKNKIIKLPDGDNLGKLIVDNYLKSSKCKDLQERINLSKEYNILINETAFYAKIENEVPVKDKMIKITNKDKEASNNKIEEKNQPQNTIEQNVYNDEVFGYDKDEIQPEKTGFLGFFSNLFSKDNNIIRRRLFKLNDRERKRRELEYDGAANNEFVYKNENNYEFSAEYSLGDEKVDDVNVYEDEDKGYSTLSTKNMENNISSKKGFDFDKLILNQDIIEGTWKKDEQSEILIKHEKDIYEKIKKYSEDKNIKDEEVIITLLVLYYIYNKKSDKVNELKFIINKAKKYLKKIFHLEYEKIIKEIEEK